MNLLICGKCFDVRRVHRDGVTRCDCGESSAFHSDDVHVEVRGESAQKVFVDSRDVANALCLPGGLEVSVLHFDWRTRFGWRGGTWLRDEGFDEY